MDWLFKSRKTVLELLQDRGYSKVSSSHMTLEEFETWAEALEHPIKDEMEFIVSDEIFDDILVHWHIPHKLGSQELTNLISRMREMDIKRALVLVENSVTHCAKATLNRLKQEGTYIDVFTMEEIQFNISHHSLVPKHEVCSHEEKAQLMKAYAVDRTQLPNIKTTDPMARYLGVTKGQLIRITRDSDTMVGHKTISYRLVA